LAGCVTIAKRQQSTMLRSLLDALRARLGPAHPEVMVRLQQIDVWLESLLLAEARKQALALIANPDWFVTEPSTGVGTIAPQAPATVRDLFGQFSLIRGRYCDCRLVASECSESETESGLLRIGWDDEHVELCTGAQGDIVFRIATDVPGDEAREGSVPSVYHALLRVGAILGYVAPPPAAA
jgi:hypothetical protein